ncbi:MAG: hypothetical protein INR64_08295, partial [Caulobacteraceae bacterium]|nr:hypothetical protein [Caulobacter sp.]
MRNTAGMGHPGNWSERKLQLERSRAAARAERERAAKAAPDSQVIYLWGDTYNFLALHPCATQRMGL